MRNELAILRFGINFTFKAIRMLSATFIFVLVLTNTINATTYHVAKTGNDRNNGTTSPFLSIQRGINALRAGDTLFVHAGVYIERIIVADRNGTADNPIVISAYPNERPVIDGNGLDLGGDGNGLVSIFSAYVRLNGFEIRNVDMNGMYDSNMAVYLNGNNVISNCIVHNAYHGGVIICGDNNLMEYCTIYDCSMYNSDLLIKSGNSAGVSIRGLPTRSVTANYNTIRNCTMYNVYGETVSAVYTQHTVMEDNVVYQGGIYVCNSQNGLYQRNFVYIQNDMGEFRHAAIGCDNEYSGNTNSDNTIINNICYGAWSNFFSTSLINCTIANNTFVNSRYDWGVIIYRGFKHSNSRFVNNIVIQEGSAPCIFYDGSGGITFSNNLWNKTPVSNLEGGYARGTGDVISTNSIIKSGTYTSTEYYKLFQGSPAMNAGINVTSSDFENNPRSFSDIGAFEFNSGKVDPISPVYVSSAIENSNPSRLEMTYSLSLTDIIPAASAFSVMVNSSSRSVTGVSVLGTKVVLNLSSPVSSGNIVTVAYTKPSVNPLQTPSGGQAATIIAQSVANNVAAVTVPAYVSSEIEDSNPSLLEITYNLNLAGIIPAASAFSVMVNSSSRPVTGVSVSGVKVILTLSSPVTYGNTVTVAYTKPSVNPLQTFSGGQAATISAQSVANNVAAVNVPLYVSSVIENSNPSLLEMTYNLNLSDIVPSASAFSVMVNSSSRSVTSVSVSGAKVILTLSSPVSSGNTVTVAYTKPSVNPLQTPSGGQAANIGPQSVKNNLMHVNRAPVVLINSPVKSYSGFVGEISAEKSYDADKDKLIFSWVAPSSVHVSSTTAETIRFLGPIVSEPTIIEFILRVSDGLSTTPAEIIPVEILPFRPEMEVAEVSGIFASSYYSHYHPFNANDGRSETMWSSNGVNEWLLVKLRQPFEVDHIKLAFNHSKHDVSFFDIFGSNDSIKWELILNKSASCGFSGDLQAFSLPPSKQGKEFSYLKLVGHGNSEDSWNYISEFKVFGYRNTRSLEFENLPVRLFPNPAWEQVTIRFIDETFQPDCVVISDLMGSVHLVKTVDPTVREFDLPLFLKGGIYFLRFGSGKVTLFSQKLIIRQR
jgi:uncharacterized repeat protein (TIGR02059 family)